jgi:hypothetical protein
MLTTECISAVLFFLPLHIAATGQNHFSFSYKHTSALSSSCHPIPDSDANCAVINGKSRARSKKGVLWSGVGSTGPHAFLLQSCSSLRLAQNAAQNRNPEFRKQLSETKQKSAHETATTRHHPTSPPFPAPTGRPSAVRLRKPAAIARTKPVSSRPRHRHDGGGRGFRRRRVGDVGGAYPGQRRGPPRGRRVGHRRRGGLLPLPVRLLARGLHPTLARNFATLTRYRPKFGLGHGIGEGGGGGGSGRNFLHFPRKKT